MLVVTVMAAALFVTGAVTQAATPFILAGVLLALLVQYGVAPRIVARENLRLWHGLGTALYAAQWLCTVVVFWRMVRPPAPGQP